MATRPLPNVDPDALSKLASQYPGSQGRAEPKLGGPGGGSGSGGPGDGGPGDDGPGDGSPSDEKGGAGNKKAPPAQRPVASKEPAVQPKGGGRGAVFFTFLFAVVALAGAIGALAAPSLRTEARAFLLQYFDEKTADFVTGQDTGRLEITYEGLDQRVARLTEALERITGAPGVQPEAARELLLRTEQNQRLGAAETAVAAVGDRVGALEAQTATLDGLRQSLETLASRVDAAEQSLTSLRETVDALEPRLAGMVDAGDRTAVAVEELSKRVDASLTDIGGRVDGLAGEVAKVQSSLQPVAAMANQVAAQRQATELPLIGMTQLRLALDRDQPYPEELALAERLVGEDAEALVALGQLKPNAETGVTTLPGLRRDFAFVASQMGGSLNRIQSWTQRLSSWLEVLVGTRTMPEADPIGEITAAVASIDAALEAGQLDLAVQEAVALNGRRSDVLLEGWIVEARRRLAVEQAFNALSDRIYARIAASG